MASWKRLIPTAARVLIATSLGVAIGVAGAAPFLTVYKYDDAGNVVRVSSTATDPDNCGDRDKPCSSNHVTRVCSNGSCAAGVCASGWDDCNGDKRADGCEVNIDTITNCGGCGAACSANHVTPDCRRLSCSLGQCHQGWGDCNGNKQADGCETDLTRTAIHCGGCGLACSTNHITPSCSASSCEGGTCAAGWGNCNGNKRSDGCETPLTTTSNCGACGRACPFGQVCSSGICARSWNPPPEPVCNCSTGYKCCEPGVCIRSNLSCP